MIKCKNCGEKIIKFPIKKQSDKTFKQNFDEGTINWLNFFKMDFMSIVWIVVIILIVTTYKADTETCREIVTRPLTYCEESNACKIIEERKLTNPYGLIDLDIPDFEEVKVNNTKW